MNIKEHIDQGHYPTDDKGRPLVPTDSGGVAVIGDTNAMDGNCMLGWMRGHSHDINNCIGWWQDDGTPYTPVRRLLPPPPRKRKIVRYGIIDRGGRFMSCLTYDTQQEAEAVARNNTTMDCTIELSGEHEVPWP